MAVVQNRCPAFVTIIFHHGFKCCAVSIKFPILICPFAVGAHPLVAQLNDSQIGNRGAEQFNSIGCCDFYVSREIGLISAVVGNRQFRANRKVQCLKLNTGAIVIQTYIGFVINIIGGTGIVIFSSLAACISFAANFSPI